MIAGVAAFVLANPICVRAQRRSTPLRIGYLGNLPPTSPESRAVVDAFVSELRRLGWDEPGNVIFEFRFANGMGEQFLPLARELVASKVDVIAAMTTAAATAAKKATSKIPVVFIAAEPVENGLIGSLSRPGGNLTGMSLALDALIGKRLQLLTQAVAGITRIAYLGVGEEKTVDLVSPHRAQITKLIAAQRAPAMFSALAWVREGGLLAYSEDAVDLWHRAAGYVDHILRGAKPGDLPVEEPTRFILAVNLRTARSLGITVQRTVLLQASEVIE